MSTQKVSGGEVTFEVDSPSQYDQVPLDTYFKDNYQGIILYKTEQGEIVNPYNVWVTKTFNLTQAEMRIINSANGGSGYILFAALGAMKGVQVADPILHINQTAGAAAAGVYTIAGAQPDSWEFMDCEVFADIISNGASSFFINESNSQGSLLFNRALCLVGPQDFPDFEGTAKLVLRYRILDFSE